MPPDKSRGVGGRFADAALTPLGAIQLKVPGRVRRVQPTTPRWTAYGPCQAPFVSPGRFVRRSRTPESGTLPRLWRQSPRLRSVHQRQISD